MLLNGALHQCCIDNTGKHRNRTDGDDIGRNGLAGHILCKLGHRQRIYILPVLRQSVDKARVHEQDAIFPDIRIITVTGLLGHCKDEIRTAHGWIIDGLIIDDELGTAGTAARLRPIGAREDDFLFSEAAGSLCKRWWQARVLGTNDCGCGGKETQDEDQAPVAEIVVA